MCGLITVTGEMTALMTGVTLCVGVAVAPSPASSVTALPGGLALAVDPIGVCLSVTGAPLFVAADQFVCSYLSICCETSKNSGVEVHLLARLFTER